MAAVWLSRRDCEEGTLPRVCLRCGCPADGLVEKDFFGTLLWGAPLTYVLALVWGEKMIGASIRVPMCSDHRTHWRNRWWTLLAALVALVLTAGADLGSLAWISHFGPTSPEAPILYLVAFSCHVLGTALMLFVGWVATSGIHALEIHENGIRLRWVSRDFARAYEDGDRAVDWGVVDADRSGIDER